MASRPLNFVTQQPTSCPGGMQSSAQRVMKKHMNYAEYCGSPSKCKLFAKVNRYISVGSST